ncbi:MAG: hypothetical protein ACLQPV_01710 [Vulcanimicrobiaceae bacterium]
MRQHAFSVLFSVVALVGSATPALAISTQSTQPVTVSYVAAFEPQFRSAFPYSGTMQLTFREGIVSGTYRDMSIRPGGPLHNGMNVAVTGGTSGGNINFSIGSDFRVRGTIAKDGTIEGTATYAGRLYNFLAKVGTPGSGSGT